MVLAQLKFQSLTEKANFQEQKPAMKHCRLLFSFQGSNLEIGENDAEVPPVPIPNTEVKLDRAENTWLETTWEDR